MDSHSYEGGGVGEMELGTSWLLRFVSTNFKCGFFSGHSSIVDSHSHGWSWNHCLL
jgi:hypothetical protein